METTKQLIVLCGPAGSGKSTLSQEFVRQGFRYVNQDEQGKTQHMSNFLNDIFNSHNVIVDRMGFNKEQRNRYLEPAKKAGYKTKIIVLHESYDTCLGRMINRKDHPTIKDEETAKKALHTFFTKYERPTEDEANEIEFRYPEGDKPLAVICDLDGTLCNIKHRLHYVIRKRPHPRHGTSGQKSDWKAFFEGIKDDSLNEWCASILNRFKNTHYIILASGRPDTYMKSTKDWLKNNLITYDHLFMRSKNDFRQDDIVKEIILDFEILCRYTPVFFIDDRTQVVRMWRNRGFICLQVAEGNF